MKILLVGLIFHQHITNFARSLKDCCGYELYGMNTDVNNDGPIVPPSYFIQIKNIKEMIKGRGLIAIIGIYFSFLKEYLSFHSRFNIVQFHFVSIYVFPLAFLARIRGEKVSSFVWGSDLLRASSLQKKCLRLTFLLSNSIVCESKLVYNKLLADYPQYKKKISLVLFGSEIIDNLSKETISNVECKNLLFKNSPIVVMVGYNGSKGQNHLQIIESLKDYSKSCMFIFPMTYGTPEGYHDEVKNLLVKYDFNYIILDSFLPDEEWSKYILSTDIYINMQITDSFSSTLAEHLFVNNIVLNAEWLQYPDLEDKAVKYINVNFDNLNIYFENCINDISSYKKKFKSSMLLSK